MAFVVDEQYREDGSHGGNKKLLWAEENKANPCRTHAEPRAQTGGRMAHVVVHEDCHKHGCDHKVEAFKPSEERRRHRSAHEVAHHTTIDPIQIVEYRHSQVAAVDIAALGHSLTVAEVNGKRLVGEPVDK